MRRLLASLATFSMLLLALAPAALASNDGRGFYGATNDKVVTNVGFMLIAFFPLFIGFASLIQWRLEKRKEAREHAAAERIGTAEWHGGW